MHAWLVNLKQVSQRVYHHHMQAWQVLLVFTEGQENLVDHAAIQCRCCGGLYLDDSHT